MTSQYPETRYHISTSNRTLECYCALLHLHHHGSIVMFDPIGGPGRLDRPMYGRKLAQNPARYLVPPLLLLLFLSIYAGTSRVTNSSWRPPTLPSFAHLYQGSKSHSLHQLLGGSSRPVFLPKIHLFVPINEAAAQAEDKHFCRAMQGAIVNGWEPILFNWRANSRLKKAKPAGESTVYLIGIGTRPKVSQSCGQASRVSIPAIRSAVHGSG